MWDKYILEIKNFIPKGLSEHMINKFESDDRKVDGVYKYDDINGEEITMKKYNTELGISNYPNEWGIITKELDFYMNDIFTKYIEKLKMDFDISDREHIYFQEINDILNGFYNITHCGYNLQRIKEGDKYSWHHDGELHQPLFIQIIFYLNNLEEHQGGCTEFLNGRKIKPECGKVLVYPCSWLFPHCGNEVKMGSKYICTTTVILNKKE